MTFIGRIKRGSHVWASWKNQKRVGGAISNIPFHITKSGDFESIILNADQIIDLHGVASVEMIAVGIFPSVNVTEITECSNFRVQETQTQEINEQEQQQPPVPPSRKGRPPKINTFIDQNT